MVQHATSRDFQPCVYIMASRKRGTLYIGVTSRLTRRAWEHKGGLVRGFTARYRVKLLVYYEFHATMHDAIRREKQLKEWHRAWKVRLVESVNPAWRDLYQGLVG